MSEPPPDEPSEEGSADPYRATALLRTVVAQGTFIAALLFYLGAMYMSTFYSYFRISLSTLDLGFGELVTQSLRLLKLEVLVAAGLIVLVVAAPWARARTSGPEPTRTAAKAEAMAARLSVPVVAVGVVLLALWRQIQPYGWIAPLVIAQLSLPTGTVRKEVLASGLRHRYRYTGLRLLLERDGRYYVVPVGWNVERDAMYIIQESDTVWIGLTPGTLPKLLG
ncbi:hypothetical protein [Streptomyces sp. NPDC026092]|uniref:hypothetical protein n=1 Tax=Streptomyces sp. NPDC026092 TaxID=3154797 RepID=UPI0033DCBEA8